MLPPVSRAQQRNRPRCDTVTERDANHSDERRQRQGRPTRNATRLARLHAMSGPGWALRHDMKDRQEQHRLDDRADVEHPHDVLVDTRFPIRHESNINHVPGLRVGTSTRRNWSPVDRVGTTLSSFRPVRTPDSRELLRICQHRRNGLLRQALAPISTHQHEPKVSRLRVAFGHLLKHPGDKHASHASIRICRPVPIGHCLGITT